jgi:hypothetical protein
LVIGGLHVLGVLVAVNRATDATEQASTSRSTRRPAKQEPAYTPDNLTQRAKK